VQLCVSFVGCRLGYDDFNESLCTRDIVYGVLTALSVQPAQIANGDLNDAYSRLTNMGFSLKTSIGNTFDPQVRHSTRHSVQSAQCDVCTPVCEPFVVFFGGYAADALCLSEKGIGAIPVTGSTLL
jgi:hypothetical protein